VRSLTLLAGAGMLAFNLLASETKGQQQAAGNPDRSI
jgi:hypothetical protein